MPKATGVVSTTTASDEACKELETRLELPEFDGVDMSGVPVGILKFWEGSTLDFGVRTEANADFSFDLSNVLGGAQARSIVEGMPMIGLAMDEDCIIRVFGVSAPFCFSDAAVSLCTLANISAVAGDKAGSTGVLGRACWFGIEVSILLYAFSDRV